MKSLHIVYHDKDGLHKHSLFETIVFLQYFYPARALRALGLLLADGAPTVGGGKTF